MTDMIGKPKEALDTPVLLIDLDVLEKNIAKMAQTICKDGGVGWRPHTKGMKTPALAHKLLNAGAHGVTCAKLGEAEVMAMGGVKDILIANQIVTPQKITRLVNIRKHSDVMVAVDCVENVEAIDRAAQAKGVVVRVVIEVDTGMNRAGVQPGETTLALAQKITGRKGVHLAGLMTWEAHAISIKDIDEKRRVIDEALTIFTNTAQLCRDNGIPIEILSCGGTGTYWISAVQDGITELQAGGGIYSDIQYRHNFCVEHDYALTVLSSVTSRPVPDRIICDAGKKTMSTDAAVPEPSGIENVESVKCSAEHGIINLSAPADGPAVGEQVEFVVGYSDTTVVLHNEIYGIRDGIVETVWPLWGRGKLQ